MIGQTISHYRVVEPWAVAAWVWSIRPRMSSSDRRRAARAEGTRLDERRWL